MPRLVAPTILAVLMLASGVSGAEPAKEAPLWVPMEVENFRVSPGVYRVPLHVDEPAGVARRAQAVRFGVPAPKGVLRDLRQLRLEDEAKTEQPMQAEAGAYWADGSVRWIIIDAQLGALKPQERRKLYLTLGAGVQRSEPAAGVKVTEDAERITIDTGKLRAVLLKHKSAFIYEAWLDRNGDGKYDGAEQIVASLARGEMRGLFVDLYKPVPPAGLVSAERAPATGMGPYWAALDPVPEEVKVEAAGPVCAEICVRGWHRAEHARDEFSHVAPATFKYVLRMRFYAGSSTVRVFHTFVNTEDPVDVRVLNIGIRLPVRVEGALRHSFGTAAEMQVDADASAAHYLVQEHWDSFRFERGGPMPKLEPKPGDDPHLLLGKYQGGTTLKHGAVAEGWADVSGRDAGVTLIFRDMAKLFPKELGFEGPVTYAYMWPAHKRPTTYEYFPGGNKPFMDLRHPTQVMDPALQRFKEKSPELYQQYLVGSDSDWERYQTMADRCSAVGVGKTHEIVYDFHAGPVDPERAAAEARGLSDPVQPYATPQWYCWATEALGRMHPHDPTNFPALEKQFDRFGEWLWRHQNEWSHFLGMFDYGDFQTFYKPGSSGFARGYADDEFGPWGKYLGRYGWLNGEHNNDFDLWLQYFRTGRYREFKLAYAYAAHRMDVDTCNYHPKPEWVGAQHRHSILHWSDWLIDQQTYNDGIAALYYATGDRRARDVAIQVGRFSMFPRTADRYFLETEGTFSTVKHQEHRGTWCRIANIARMYEITGDPEVRRYLDAYAGVMEDNLEPTGGPRDLNSTVPYLGAAFSNWYNATENPRVRDIIVATGFALPSPNVLGNFGPYAALQYHLTGDDGPLIISGITRRQRLDADPADGPVEPGSFGSARTTPLIGHPHLMGAVYDARFDDVAAAVKPREAPTAPPAGTTYRMIDLHAQMNADAFGDMITGQALPWPEPDAPSLRDRLSTLGGRVEFGGSGDAALASDQSITAKLKPGQAPLTNWSIYPSYEFEMPVTRQFSPPPPLLHWGVVPFFIADSRQNRGRSMISLRGGESVRIPVGLTAKRLYFLGHVFALRYEGPLGAVPMVRLLEKKPIGLYRVRYKGGKTVECPIVNRQNASPWLYGVQSPLAPFAHGQPGRLENVWPDQGGVCAFELEIEPGDVESIEFAGTDPNKAVMLYAVTALVDGGFNKLHTVKFHVGPDRGDGYETIGERQLADDTRSGWLDATGVEPAEVSAALPLDGALRTLRVRLPEDGWYTVAGNWIASDVAIKVVANGRLSHNGMSFFAEARGGAVDLVFHLRPRTPYNGANRSARLVLLQFRRMEAPPLQPPPEVDLSRQLRYGWDPAEPYGGESGCVQDATLRMSAPPGRYRVTMAFKHPFGTPDVKLDLTAQGNLVADNLTVTQPEGATFETVADAEGIKVRVAVDKSVSQGRLLVWGLDRVTVERLE